MHMCKIGFQNKLMVEFAHKKFHLFYTYMTSPAMSLRCKYILVQYNYTQLHTCKYTTYKYHFILLGFTSKICMYSYSNMRNQ